MHVRSAAFPSGTYLPKPRPPRTAVQTSPPRAILTPRGPIAHRALPLADCPPTVWAMDPQPCRRPSPQRAQSASCPAIGSRRKANQVPGSRSGFAIPTWFCLSNLVFSNTPWGSGLPIRFGPRTRASPVAIKPSGNVQSGLSFSSPAR
jgi:hypothetical protein